MAFHIVPFGRGSVLFGAALRDCSRRLLENWAERSRACRLVPTCPMFLTRSERKVRKKMDERKRGYLARLAAQIESQARAPGRNLFSEAPVMPHSLSLRLPAVGGLCQPVNVCTYEVSLSKWNNKGIHKTQLKQRSSTEKQNNKKMEKHIAAIFVFFFFKFVHLGWQSKIIEIAVVFFFSFIHLLWWQATRHSSTFRKIYACRMFNASRARFLCTLIRRGKVDFLCCFSPERTLVTGGRRQPPGASSITRVPRVTCYVFPARWEVAHPRAHHVTLAEMLAADLSFVSGACWPLCLINTGITAYFFPTAV